jgi:hypothetical protein
MVLADGSLGKAAGEEGLLVSAPGALEVVSVVVIVFIVLFV